MITLLTQTSPSAGSNVTVLPGYSGVPLWSVLPIHNKEHVNKNSTTKYIILIKDNIPW
jgi:hypothetical protein